VSFACRFCKERRTKTCGWKKFQKLGSLCSEHISVCPSLVDRWLGLLELPPLSVSQEGCLPPPPKNAISILWNSLGQSKLSTTTSQDVTIVLHHIVRQQQHLIHSSFYTRVQTSPDKHAGCLVEASTILNPRSSDCQLERKPSPKEEEYQGLISFPLVDRKVKNVTYCS
jgi:hypothetical protein